MINREFKEIRKILQDVLSHSIYLEYNLFIPFIINIWIMDFSCNPNAIFEFDRLARSGYVLKPEFINSIISELFNQYFLLSNDTYLEV